MPAKTLGAIEPVDHDGDPRRELAEWLTSPENEMFSRNLANRIWEQLLGRGIVEPVDDVRVSNPPTNEPLLDALSQQLVASHFSLRSLVRYLQLASVSTERLVQTTPTHATLVSFHMLVSADCEPTY